MTRAGSGTSQSTSDGDWFRCNEITEAPSVASRSTTAWPIPRFPPVTSATRPSNLAGRAAGVTLFGCLRHVLSNVGLTRTNSLDPGLGIGRLARVSGPIV